MKTEPVGMSIDNMDIFIGNSVYVIVNNKICMCTVKKIKQYTDSKIKSLILQPFDKKKGVLSADPIFGVFRRLEAVRECCLKSKLNHYQETWKRLLTTGSDLVI